MRRPRIRRTAATLLIITSTAAVSAGVSDAAPGPQDHHQHHPTVGIHSPRGDVRPAAFDLVQTTVRRHGTTLVFTQRVSGWAGSVRPKPTGQLPGSSVLSYVWPTSLDPSTVGFTRGSGVLALAATAHPDFDDTPLYDENHNGGFNDDGYRWHVHWVVLVPDTTRPDGALKVRDIAAGEGLALPKTWPGVPLYLDSPPYSAKLHSHTVSIQVPLADLGFPPEFNYDGVTAALRINANLHDPLLRVTNVFDIASGDLSLPGRVTRAERPRLLGTGRG